jgi:hypothetical protein
MCDQLEIIKFLCKDIWHLAFGKSVDNLKTNNRGTFVLTDTHHPLLVPFTSDPAHPDTAKLAITMLAFPCGFLRGALGAFGVEATVVGEVTAFPQAIFQVVIPQQRD